MNLDMFDRRRAERFAQLLDETSGGPRRHTRSQSDDRLTELAAIGHTLSAVRPAVQVDPEFRTGLRAMLVATAERDGIGDPAPSEPAPGVHTAVPAPRAAGLFARGTGRRIRARGAIVLGVAAGALAVSGISAASENAVPGDALYGVKRSTERAQLAMAGSDITRGQLSLGFARTRLDEAAALAGDSPDFPPVLDDMDNDTRQGIRVLTTSAMARKDATPLDAIETFVTGQRHVIAPLLDRLATGNRTRAMTSMGLLDDIVRRADGLRSALGCDSDATAGSDSLGPRPRACWVGSESDSPGDHKPGQGQEITSSGIPTTSSRGPAGRSRSTGRSTPVPGGTPQASPAAGGTVHDDAVDEQGDRSQPRFPPGHPVDPQPTAEPTATSGPGPAEDHRSLLDRLGSLFDN